MDLTREQTHTLFTIQNKIEWFNESSAEAFHTLYIEDCENNSERDLIIDLINRITYLDNKRYHKILEGFVKDIIDKYNNDETIIYSTSMDETPDSSQGLLYDMKVKFAECGWDTMNGQNRMSKVLKSSRTKKNILIVDEFIGSGQTMINRVDTVKSELAKENIQDYNIHIYAVAGSQEGLYRLMENSIDFTCEIELSKGISDIYKNEEITLKINEMKRLESLLSEENGKCELSRMHLGYSRTEALFKRENGNTPNNVFPIFWWKYYANNSKRKTLMTRMC
ncbi:MAG: hypothetical protein GQ531_03385 [Sulfurovum sp.]|nr:hypothetical protein [Sulfurovum sp.]